MKIKEFAAEKGVTQGAIYKAIGRAGFSAKDLTDRKGNITVKGMGILTDLFPGVPEPLSDSLSEKKAEEYTNENRIDDLRTELARLRAELDAKDVECADLRDQRDKAERQAEKWEQLYLELQNRAAQEREAHREELRAAHVLAAQAQETISTLSAKKNPILRLFSGRKKEQHTAADGDVK